MLLLWLLLALPGPTFSESGHASPLWEIANMTSWEGTSSGAPVGGHAAMATCGVAMATCGVAMATCGVATATCGVAMATCGVAMATCGVATATCGVATATCGVATVSASENDGADRATGCASTGD